MQKVIVPIIVGVVALGGGFYGGMKYDASKQASARSAAFANFGGRTGGTAGRGGAGGFRAAGANSNTTAGEVLSKDNNSITVKLTDGGSKIVYLSGSTTIMTAAQGSLNDIAVGSNVMAMGTPNSDGSITAENIQLRQGATTPGVAAK